MANDQSSSPPREFRAGDSIRWTRTLADYRPADGWVLAYTLVGATSAHAISATAAGAGFTVSVSASDTSAWATGTYRLVEYVSRADERVTLAATAVCVLADLASASAGIDTRTHARKVLDNINAWLESKSITAGETQLGDRRVRQYDIADLLALRDRYVAIVANEEGGAGLVRRMVVSL